MNFVNSLNNKVWLTSSNNEIKDHNIPFQSFETPVDRHTVDSATFHPVPVVVVVS